MFLTGLSTALHRYYHVCWHLSGLHLAFRESPLFFTILAQVNGSWVMGYGLWDHGLPIFFAIGGAHAAHRERDSFNTRLVSAGQEKPRRSRHFRTAFCLFSQKCLPSDVLQRPAPFFPPFFLPHHPYLSSVLSFVFVRLLRAGQCGHV